MGMRMPDCETDHQMFSKTLTKTDVSVRLSFPAEALNHFKFPRGRDKVEFSVTDGMGNSWEFGLSKRNEARHSHPKPVLSSGWRAYVQAKGLKMDDRVILYRIMGRLVSKERKAQAQRKVRLFGKEIHGEAWVDVEKLKPEVSASIL
ncbi:hypothetical protein HRI_002032100 [Hibiscus trionum]|uniref:TF-B3 domain-containing protein n=1 Tax=Hibiscus trionum TaxID=183268 RepID=A0A9W7M0Z1_HIBTR|nr:hypothetical protein HRI_002032100 [Hibiscus trionum]